MAVASIFHNVPFGEEPYLVALSQLVASPLV